MPRYTDSEIVLEELEYKITRDNKNGMVVTGSDFITIGVTARSDKYEAR